MSDTITIWSVYQGYKDEEPGLVSAKAVVRNKTVKIVEVDTTAEKAFRYRHVLPIEEVCSTPREAAERFHRERLGDANAKRMAYEIATQRLADAEALLERITREENS